MNRIVLTQEQANQISGLEPVEVCDPDGNVIGVLPPALTPEELARIPRAKDHQGPWVTGEQVRQTLQTLEEAWEREGPFDRARLKVIIEQIRAARGA